MNNDQSPPQQPPSEKVIEEVAAHTETDPLELPPLYTVLDGDTLDAFVTELGSGKVDFQYVEVSVTVYSDGTVDVADRPPVAGPGGEWESAE